MIKWTLQSCERRECRILPPEQSVRAKNLVYWVECIVHTLAADADIATPKGNSTSTLVLLLLNKISSVIPLSACVEFPFSSIRLISISVPFTMSCRRFSTPVVVFVAFLLSCIWSLGNPETCTQTALKNVAWPRPGEISLHARYWSFRRSFHFHYYN